MRVHASCPQGEQLLGLRQANDGAPKTLHHALLCLQVPAGGVQLSSPTANLTRLLLRACQCATAALFSMSAVEFSWSRLGADQKCLQTFCVSKTTFSYLFR